MLGYYQLNNVMKLPTRIYNRNINKFEHNEILVHHNNFLIHFVVRLVIIGLYIGLVS